MKNRLDRLKTIEIKKFDNKNTVNRSFFDDKSKFPLVVQPVNSGYRLENWLSENRNQFEKDLQIHGGILFRGFSIDTVERFQNLMDGFSNNLLDYSFRSSPRFELVNNVYVSTTYPKDQIINMHSESSYAPSHPNRIVFCCIIPASVRGETPIADNRKIIEYLSDDLKRKFYEKGVLYRRNLNGLLGLPWQEVFQTSDKKKVEKECKLNEMDFAWGAGEELVLTWKKKAIWEHPQTNEHTWFNHALFFNKYMLNSDILDSVTSDDELPNNTFFGDGSSISKKEIEEIKNAYDKATIKFSWEKGDVLFLDNMLMSHGRNSYEGERKIIVSIS